MDFDFDELFRAVEVDDSNCLYSVISRFKSDLESLYNLLTQRHPVKKLTVLQWAIENYPKPSLKLLTVLLKSGAGTELPAEDDQQNEVTPLWMAVERNLSPDIIRLLLEFKADVYFKSDCFEDDEKSILSHHEGYSILHLAVRIKAQEKTINFLIQAGGALLLDDQSNRLKETPIMLAVKENNLKMVKLLLRHRSKVDLKDFNGFNVYELAAKNQQVDICLELDEMVDQLVSCDYFLEILYKPRNKSYWTRKSDLTVVVLGDLSESDELLPMEGYWEWQSGTWSTWQPEGYLFRLRRRIEIRDQPYLMEAIEMVEAGRYQAALNHLLPVLQHETDPQKKWRAAAYFQRLLQRVEKTTPALCLLDTPSILNNDNTSDNEVDDMDSDDSMLYCPVCSHRFDREDRESHLKKCLTAPRHRIIGDRFTDLSRSNLVSGECPICYEDFSSADVVVMNCLCRFHRKCIEEWLERDKQCPFHN